jgi:uncharacterized membrane-anchored protein YitT (DUF2179 family)
MIPIFTTLARALMPLYPNKSKNRDQDLHSFAIEIRDEIKDALYLAIGVASAAFGLESFLIPNGFIDGGVTGISLIVNAVSEVPVPLLLVILNLPFLIMGWRTISSRFALKSIGSIFLLALVIQFIPFPVVAEDNILVAAFGGFFLGLGIGMAVRGGGILDGTEVLAIFISRKSSLSVGNIILIFNVFIFGAGAYFLSVETALYAILTYFAASKTIDFVIDGIEEYLGVTIISNHSEEVRLAITNNLGRGCTIYQGKNGYTPSGGSSKNIDIIYTVITRLEMSKLKTEINKVDDNAFVIMNSIIDTKGGMVKKRPIEKLKSGKKAKAV